MRQQERKVIVATFFGSVKTMMIGVKHDGCSSQETAAFITQQSGVGNTRTAVCAVRLD